MRQRGEEAVALLHGVACLLLGVLEARDLGADAGDLRDGAARVQQRELRAQEGALARRRGEGDLPFRRAARSEDALVEGGEGAGGLGGEDLRERLAGQLDPGEPAQ